LSDIVWHIEKRKVKDLILDDENPRAMNTKEMFDLKRSIRKFGYATRVEINTDNRVVAGNQRVKVLLSEGRGDEEIEVLVPNRKISEEEFREYSIRNNKNVGHFEWGRLSNLNKDLLFDIGFTFEDLKKVYNKADVDKPEVEFSEELLEEHNFIVLYFDE